MTSLDSVDLPAQQAPESNPTTLPTDAPRFILYLPNPQYSEELERLGQWVQQLLLAVYGRETTSSAPWCSQWWEHPEAVAQLHGLWLAWQDLTGPGSELCGPANWHRDYLQPVMGSLRDAAGPFAGCQRAHRPKEVPESGRP